jgi:hypothetical protein
MLLPLHSRGGSRLLPTGWGANYQRHTRHAIYSGRGMAGNQAAYMHVEWACGRYLLLKY